ncbi:MAG: hypothetical protein EP330_05715 [Deltaproteobacteria bacterium]|nr:MAG: hypothetical protein EP330_05715 [Deltaproteobacteria bacterium]
MTSFVRFTTAALCALPMLAHAGVAPLLSTEWGQSDAWQQSTPTRDGEQTYPGCTTIASAQVLYYYRYTDHAADPVSYVLEHDGLAGTDIVDGVLSRDVSASRHDFDAMALSLDESAARITASANFIYEVGVTLHAQFGGGEGSSATGRQIENAFRYQWGFNHKPRREMTIISKNAFNYSDTEWADAIRGEIDAGRPVLYMGLQTDDDAGHAFVIDGYKDDGTVHVNWGWGGYGNGYYDPNTLVDPAGRSWAREPMIYLGLEPEPGFAAAMHDLVPEHHWHGNGSLIAAASGTATGYGLTEDEAMVHGGGDRPAVFFQWEVDAADGERIRFDAEHAQRATITYGPWNDRGADRTYVDVALPFVLDPRRDGFDPSAQPYYTFAITFDGALPETGVVSAKATTATGSAGTSVAAQPVRVDGYTWTGTGSLIARASGTATGYGLTLDEAALPAGTEAPMVTFQWEIDGADGRTLVIDAEGMSQAHLRYGSWATRSEDVLRTVSLPYTLDPAADGMSAADGEYYTIRVAFDAAPATDTVVTAEIR